MRVATLMTLLSVASAQCADTYYYACNFPISPAVGCNNQCSVMPTWGFNAINSQITDTVSIKFSVNYVDSLYTVRAYLVPSQARPLDYPKFTFVRMTSEQPTLNPLSNSTASQLQYSVFVDNHQLPDPLVCLQQGQASLGCTDQPNNQVLWDASLVVPDNVSVDAQQCLNALKVNITLANGETQCISQEPGTSSIHALTTQSPVASFSVGPCILP